ncbi:hypothetical protein BRADI_2g55673v3 [Brachypodium distachyon]|uniref:Uncharacterized protein n=1 Tax=Brachypodium distachyon TaxID=15368 RepID=A0A0Q3N248_BRADI|nr:hypothetical protein BRADI_2g55673v3 [Brachypodium distachyon]
MADDLGDPAAQAAALAQQQQAAQLQAQQQAAQLQAQATAAAQAQTQALAAAQEVVKAAAAAGVNIDATGLVTDLNKQTQEKSTAPKGSFQSGNGKEGKEKKETS